MRLGWLLAITAAAAQQHVLNNERETISSISLVDLLSNSTQHTLLVRALQRARLIPLLNQLNGSTLFAPSDDAIKRAKQKESSPSTAIWSYATADHDEPHRATRDNLQLALRDTLLYHILNSTLFLPNYTIPSQPLLLETLHYPSLSSYNSSFPVPPSLPGSPPDDPNPDSPNRQEGLLRGEGQRLRIVSRKDRIYYVGGDWKGEGGIKVVPNSLRNATNGDLVVIDGVLEKPINLGPYRRTPLTVYSILMRLSGNGQLSKFRPILNCRLSPPCSPSPSSTISAPPLTCRFLLRYVMGDYYDSRALESRLLFTQLTH